MVELFFYFLSLIGSSFPLLLVVNFRLNVVNFADQDSIETFLFRELADLYVFLILNITYGYFCFIW